MEPQELSEKVRHGNRAAIKVVVDAVKRNHGDLSLAAFELHISRRTLDRWGKEVPAMAKALEPHRIKPGPRPKGRSAA